MEDAEEAGQSVLKAGTLKKLKQAVVMSGKLFKSMKSTVNDVQKLSKDPKAGIPTRNVDGMPSGKGQNDEDQYMDTGIDSIVALVSLLQNMIPSFTEVLQGRLGQMAT